MSQRENPSRTTTPALPDTLRLGPVHLTVADLDRSIAYYRDNMGLRLHDREGSEAAMGAGGEDLLYLHEDPDARRAGRHAGLYHVALLHSSREELSRTANRLVATSAHVRGASDHGISEAIYLSDPDGNGFELYADRPREVWPDLANPGWDAGPRPLDLKDVLALTDDEELQREIDTNLVVGHVHLHVGDLERGLAFYRDVLGFELKTFMPAEAAFVSAGGYHHHLGFNVWRGEGILPASPDEVGLDLWTVVLDDAGEISTLAERIRAAGVEVEERDGGFIVRDPWEIPVLFTTT